MIYGAVLRSAILSTVVLLVACKPSLDDLTVWKEDFPSRDLQFVAVARTVQNGGFGSASIDTSVELHRLSGSPGIPILELGCDGPVPRPYVLDNSANRGGTVDLTVHWVDATHLRLTYRGHPQVLFLAQQAAGIFISAANET
jgi:hypothetical protein